MEKRAEKLTEGLAEFKISLDATVIQRELDFLDEICRWSTSINLTAIKGQQEGVEKHLIDSLAILPFIKEDTLLDLGTGAGFPSIPLAIARPTLDIVSVESVGKKANFQKHIRRKFNLTNLTVMNCRVEALAEETKYPLITARAFASIDKILELVKPLLSLQGRLLLMRGSRDVTIQKLNQNALQHLGYEISNEYAYQLPFSKAQRKILQISPL